MVGLCKHVVAINVFQGENLTLYIVASIHSIRKRTRKNQKLGNKLEDGKKIQESKIRAIDLIN